MNEERWRRSSFSLNGECVELAEVGDHVLVRNSNDPRGVTLGFRRETLAAWIADIKRV